MADSKSSRNETNGRFIPFFPNYLLDEMIAWYVALGGLIVLASLFPTGLEEPADPLNTPAHIKPEWFFLFLYQFFKLVPRTIGVLMPIVAGIILLLVPFLDRSPKRAYRERIVPIILGIVTVIVITVLTIWGWLS
jgi:quinol-cytochrome oxidoreductase complex cytochrome b subunit